jgi:hypothetical protein
MFCEEGTIHLILEKCWLARTLSFTDAAFIQNVDLLSGISFLNVQTDIEL